MNEKRLVLTVKKTKIIRCEEGGKEARRGSDGKKEIK